MYMQYVYYALGNAERTGHVYDLQVLGALKLKEFIIESGNKISVSINTSDDSPMFRINTSSTI